MNLISCRKFETWYCTSWTKHSELSFLEKTWYQVYIEIISPRQRERLQVCDKLCIFSKQLVGDKGRTLDSIWKLRRKNAHWQRALWMYCTKGLMHTVGNEFMVWTVWSYVVMMLIKVWNSRQVNPQADVEEIIFIRVPRVTDQMAEVTNINMQCSCWITYTSR